MAGGVGSRLFPLSTPEHPKQFLDLLECGKSLIRLTYERFLEVSPDAVFWVVTSAAYTHFVREQIPEIPASNILAEPASRNTAPCIAYACRKIALKDTDANIIVAPSDAYIPDAKAFAQTMRAALEFTAGEDSIVCVGIKPRSPHTGYGYIQAPAVTDRPVKVVSFKEKPDAELAKEYLEQGGYWWNAGIFVFSARTMEEELRSYAPQICDIMDYLEPFLYTEDEQEALGSLFPKCEKISIDYAVMEKSSRVYTIAAE